MKKFQIGTINHKKNKMSRVESAALITQHKFQDSRYHYKNMYPLLTSGHITTKAYDKKKFWEDSKRPNSTKLDQNKQQAKTKGIGITCKNYIPRSQSKNKQEKQNYQKPKRLFDTGFNHSPLGKSDLQNILKKKPQNNKKIDEDKKQNSEYKRLQQKLAYLQNKIIAIKSSIDSTKKKQYSLKKQDKQQKPKKNYSAERHDDTKLYQFPARKQRLEIHKPHPIYQQLKQKQQQKQRLKKHHSQKSIFQQKPHKSKNSQYKRRYQKKSSDLSSFVTSVIPKVKNNNVQNEIYSPKKNNLYYISQVCRSFQVNNLHLAKDHIQTSVQTLKFMSNVRRPSQTQIYQKKLYLPKNQCYKGIIQQPGKKTIIFDLDQTLIHCNESLDLAHDIALPIRFPTGDVIKAGINIRPYAKQIIKKLSYNFQIIIFTASHSCYANVVIDHIDPERRISHRLYRQNCWQTEEKMYVKDLRVLNRPMNEMVLVDNAAYSYAFQLDNGIPIIPYYQGKKQFQLQSLQQYLQQLRFVSDVRELNHRFFKLYRYIQFNEGDKLVSQLYKQLLNNN